MDFTDNQIRALIFKKLGRREILGGHVYKPVQTIIKWIVFKIKKNGDLVKKIMKDLVKEGYLLTKKRGQSYFFKY